MSQADVVATRCSFTVSETEARRCKVTCVDQTTSVVGGCQGSNHTSTVLKLYYLTEISGALI